MFYYIIKAFAGYVSAFNVFRYITIRSAYALITALLISFIFGPMIIRFLKRIKFSHIRDFVPDSHQLKSGTPSMGGLMIILSVVVSTLIWGDLSSPYTILPLIVVVWLGALGFLDDFLKITKKNPEGVIARYKLIAQALLGLAVGFYLYYFPYDDQLRAAITVPFFKYYFANLGWLYIPFVMFVIMGTSNAVNLTDGLDGLAIGNVGVAIMAYAAIAYVTGHKNFADYLNIPFLPGTGELTVFCLAIVGAALGFLWFNAYPAGVFMGDTGSMALGGALGIVAVLLKREILLIIIGGVFVMEALSVILQIFYFKATKGKRLFLLAPLHHHFEKMGWSESKVTVRFWILGIMFALVGLSTLKLQ